MHNVIIIVISSYHDFMIAPFVFVCFLEWNRCNKNNMVSPVTAVKTVTCGHLFMEGWMANGGNWLQSSCVPIYRSEPAHPETGWWLKLQNHSDFLLLTSQTWTVWLIFFLVVNYCDFSKVWCCLDISFPRPNGYGFKPSYLGIKTAGNTWDLWMSISPKYDIVHIALNPFPIGYIKQPI